MDVRDALGAVPLLADTLQPPQIDALAAHARAVRYEAGSEIIREHDPGTAMFIIVGGKVAVTIDDGAGQRSVATLGPGQIFGEISLLTGQPRLGTVTAEDDVEAIEITRAMLQPILTATPSLFERFATLLQKRQGDLDQIVDPAFWSRFGRSRESLAKTMRRNFADGG